MKCPHCKGRGYFWEAWDPLHLTGLAPCSIRRQCTTCKGLGKMKAMALSEVTLDRIKVGQRVRSRATGGLGTIVGKSEKIDREDYTIDIDWDSGAKSHRLWHFWCNEVEFYEEK